MSGLFSPVRWGSLELPNRIMVSPMCQYSAINGTAQPWHTIHLGSLAISGAGVLFLEATAVSPDGRITPGCLGLYNDENQNAIEALVASLRSVSTIPLAIQLAHAGRKASSYAPWDRGQLISKRDGGWDTYAPSAIPHRPEETAPIEMSLTDIKQVIDDFATSAKRSKELGFDAIEIHLAHGYLLHQFLSPVSNHRKDEYGGSLENRMRLPLEVFDAVRETADAPIAVGARISATDWVDNGWDVEQSTILAKTLEQRKCDFMDVSSGGVSWEQKIKLGPGYQVEFAQAIKKELSIPVIAVGMITEPAHAQQIIEQGNADVVALARGFLSNPRWPWHAAIELNGQIEAPRQYWRSMPADTPDVFGKPTFGMR